MAPKNKILVIGPRGSGKTTLFKQTEIFAQGALSVEELMEYTPLIRQNVVEMARAVIRFLQSQKATISTPVEDREAIFSLILSADDHEVLLSIAVADAISNLWRDQLVHRLIAHRSAIGGVRLDSEPYFFSKVRDIASEDYIPSEQDTLRVPGLPWPYSGVLECQFRLSNNTPVHLSCMPSNSSDRRKWLHFFEDAKVVILCVGSSDYDQDLSPAVQNPITEACALFAEIVNSPIFRRSTILVLLNKLDILQEKIQTLPFETIFPHIERPRPADLIRWMLLDTRKVARAAHFRSIAAVDLVYMAAFFEHTLVNFLDPIDSRFQLGL